MVSNYILNVYCSDTSVPIHRYSQLIYRKRVNGNGRFPDGTITNSVNTITIKPKIITDTILCNIFSFFFPPIVTALQFLSMSHRLTRQGQNQVCVQRSIYCPVFHKEQRIFALVDITLESQQSGPFGGRIERSERRWDNTEQVVFFCTVPECTNRGYSNISNR